MKHLALGSSDNYPVVVLTRIIDGQRIKAEYLDPIELDMNSVLCLDLYYPPEKKTPNKKEMVEYIEQELVPVLIEQQTQFIVCGDAAYFKTLTGAAKADSMFGYVMPCLFGDWQVVYVPNYSAVFYDPTKVRAHIHQSMQALRDFVEGCYIPPGKSIVKFEAYPSTLEDIKASLDRLLEMNVPLTVDIEAFSLKHFSAGIGSIAFCWSKHEGIAFAVDYQEIPGATEAPYGIQVKNEPVRALLKDFCLKAQNKMIYHNIAYDGCVLIYQLFMNHILDQEGLHAGLETILKNWDDTKLITYLATNSCAGNKLSLKDQAQEYAGNYAQTDIKDITRIPLNKLLRYNLVDGLSTWYVRDKHWPTMVADNQLDIYQTLFKPAIKDIIQLQLTGMPVNMIKVIQAQEELQLESIRALSVLRASQHVQHFTYTLREKWVAEKNAKLKKKRVTIADAEVDFNPNSGLQLQSLLFDFLGLPVLERTKTKQPSTDADTLKALRAHTTDPTVLDLLNALLDHAAVDIILTSFIPAMLNAQQGDDGWHYLFGNFNLGGTVSGRLSSSKPNLQNLPASGTKYGKIIKNCFEAPTGWIFCGLDFLSLEDRISALTTKDPNKLRVYTDGYDGHSLRAFAYFPMKCVGITETVESINSIADIYPEQRQASKAPTFALTYMGTWKTLVKNCGFTEEVAKEIEANYHKLYAVSDAWVARKLEDATKLGYVTVAFGLRVRTPMLSQVIRGNRATPFEAEAEARTAGNALGQSWCLLNTRASIEFMNKVRASKFKYSIKPCAHIHDAQYFLIRDDMGTLMYVNEHLPQAAAWQDHSDIAHPTVGLGGKLSVFYPSWAKEIVLPNGASAETIQRIIDEALA